ncbi:MAG: hypothetical protein HY819_19840 [Acidobacteria bacterium]|nr:hypothetical protein [Acidobacteriota bacterium]
MSESETLKFSFYRREKFVGIVSLIICLLIYILRLNSAVGLFKDDAWYLLLAQSISSGNGYQLLNFPLLGITPVYPPGMPTVLAFICYLNPKFPENIWLLKSVSIVSMFFLGIMIYYYFQKYRNLAKLPSLGIALVTVICPAFVFLATSTLMSECFFTALQIATILVIETYVKKASYSKFPYLVLLGAFLASSAFLTRTIGVVIIGASVLFLATKRLWTGVAVFILGVVICILPWTVYKKVTFQEPLNPLVTKQYGVTNYNDEFWKLRAGSLERITVADLPARFLKNIQQISELNIGGMLLPIAFRGARESGEEVLGMTGVMDGNLGTKVFSWTFAIIIALGFALSLRSGLTLAELVVLMSLTLIIAWPWLPFRFILTLFPFLVFYALTTFQQLQLWLSKIKNLVSFNDEWLIAKIFLLFLLIVSFYDHLGYIQAKKQTNPKDQPQWIYLNRVYLEMFTYINEKTPIDSVITTDNPALVFLYTKRKTLVVTERDFEAFNVKYLVKTEINLPKTTVLGTSILGKKLLYHNPDFNLMVLSVNDKK